MGYEFNKGVLIGVTRDSKGVAQGKAMVNIRGLASGKVKLPIYHPEDGREISNLNVYSDKNGRYIIRFLYDKAEWGESIAHELTFRPRVFRKNSGRNAGNNERGHGKVFDAPDVQSLVSSILPMLPTGVDFAEMAGFKLPGAFATVFSPRLSNRDRVAFAYCDLYIP